MSGKGPLRLTGPGAEGAEPKTWVFGMGNHIFMDVLVWERIVLAVV
jgi:hypothetical protein